MNVGGRKLPRVEIICIYSIISDESVLKAYFVSYSLATITKISCTQFLSKLPICDQILGGGRGAHAPLLSGARLTQGADLPQQCDKVC